MNDRETAQGIAQSLPEMNKETALWLVAIIMPSDTKYAIIDRDEVQSHFDEVFSDEDWETISKSFEWRNLDSYMYDGAWGGLDFMRTQEGV